MSCTLEPVLQSGDTDQWLPFLTAVNQHNVDLHKDIHYQVKHR